MPGPSSVTLRKTRLPTAEQTKASCPPGSVCTSELRTMLSSACVEQVGVARDPEPRRSLDGDGALAERTGAGGDLIHQRAGFERLEVSRGTLETCEREQLVEQSGHPERLGLDHAQ